MTNGFARLWVSAAILLSASRALAQGADSLRGVRLREVEVSARRVSQDLKHSDGRHRMSMELMERMPRILGNADPMHYTQLLPGVQTNGEYDAGLYVQGCDNSHNMVGINGVPIYNAAHLLGFFSVFNATHFSHIELEKSVRSAASPNRLGAELQMMPDTSLATRPTGSLSVGPMSSQGTLRLPTGPRSTLTLSAREAYLNLLYSPWLKVDDEQLRYAFGDYNLTWMCRPDGRNRVWADFYAGHDRMGYDNPSMGNDTHIRWTNVMGALHWSRRMRHASTLTQSLHYTRYAHRLTLEQTRLSGQMPSGIADVGYRAHYTRGPLQAGADLAWHDIRPQRPHIDSDALQAPAVHAPREHSLEASLYGAYTQPLSPQWEASAALRANLYAHGGHTRASADPTLTLTHRPSPHAQAALSLGLKHQYLFRSGFSAVGLPTEFWFSSNSSRPPQYACQASLAGHVFLRDHAWRLSGEVYAKRLYHQAEYMGNLLDLVYTDYDLDRQLLFGHGYNYGLNLMAEKRTGRVTGWASYAVGRALRRFPGSPYTGTYPARHERIHELNLAATCRLPRRWSVGATFVVASGTPYTRVERFYLLGGNLLAQYGPHNGSRTKPYLRLDLSASYEFRPRRRVQSGINLSVYNASKYSNHLFHRLKVYKDRYYYAPFHFITDILPSVNYYCRF